MLSKARPRIVMRVDEWIGSRFQSVKRSDFGSLGSNRRGFHGRVEGSPDSSGKSISAAVPGVAGALRQFRFSRHRNARKNGANSALIAARSVLTRIEVDPAEE